MLQSHPFSSSIDLIVIVIFHEQEAYKSLIQYYETSSISKALLLLGISHPSSEVSKSVFSPNMRKRKIVIKYSVFPVIVSFSDRL